MPARIFVRAFFVTRKEPQPHEWRWSLVSPTSPTVIIMPQRYQALVDTLYTCARYCDQCATLSLREKDIASLTECIRRAHLCAEICRATAVFLSNASEHGPHLCRECAEVCFDCAEECDRHDMEHCKLCAEACRRCIEACRTFIG